LEFGRTKNETQNVYSAKGSVIPRELKEPNPRLWAFIVLLGIVLYLMVTYPVKSFDGYVDPFYAPTILILPLVGLFRVTCYAYRKDYHRHIFKHPIECAVGSRGDSASRPYTGETGFFRFENLHRYFLYVSILILPFFYYDVYKAVAYNSALTFAALLIAINTILVTVYLFSCHAFRHLTGGRIDCFGCKLAGQRRKSYFDFQSYFNAHHEQLAWISLLMFILVDLYLRALGAGLPINFTILHL
jgi:hypothetical protein